MNKIISYLSQLPLSVLTEAVKSLSQIKGTRRMCNRPRKTSNTTQLCLQVKTVGMESYLGSNRDVQNGGSNGGD